MFFCTKFTLCISLRVHFVFSRLQCSVLFLYVRWCILSLPFFVSPSNLYVILFMALRFINFPTPSFHEYFISARVVPLFQILIFSRFTATSLNFVLCVICLAKLHFISSSFLLVFLLLHILSYLHLCFTFVRVMFFLDLNITCYISF